MHIMNVIKGIALSGMLLVASNIFAQQPMPKQTPEQRADHQTKWMEKTITLSAKQSDQVYNIILDHARAMDKTFDDERGREQKITRRGILLDKDAQLKKVLTGEQYAQYQKMVKEKREQRRAHKADMQQMPY